MIPGGLIEYALAALLPKPARERLVAEKPNHRLSCRCRITGRHEQASLFVPNSIGYATHSRADDGRATRVGFKVY